MTAWSSINEMTVGAGILALVMLAMVVFVLGAVEFVRRNREASAERDAQIDDMQASIRRSGSYKMAVRNGVHHTPPPGRA